MTEKAYSDDGEDFYIESCPTSKYVADVVTESIAYELEACFDELVQDIFPNYMEDNYRVEADLIFKKKYARVKKEFVKFMFTRLEEDCKTYKICTNIRENNHE